VPSEDHEEDRPEHLLLIEDVAVLLDVYEAADYVVGRRPALMLE